MHAIPPVAPGKVPPALPRSARALRVRTTTALTALLAAQLAAAPPAAAQHRPDGWGRGAPAAGQHGPGSAHGGGGAGRARAAIYDIVTVGAVTDPAAAKAASARLGPALAGTNGRLLVDADEPTALLGTGPSHVAVIVFDDVWSAQAWQKSEAVRSILADLGKAGTVQVVSAGGIADPGARPSVPAEALGPGRAVRLPAVPKIADICKGC